MSDTLSGVLYVRGENGTIVRHNVLVVESAVISEETEEHIRWRIVAETHGAPKWVRTADEN